MVLAQICLFGYISSRIEIIFRFFLCENNGSALTQHISFFILENPPWSDILFVWWTVWIFFFWFMRSIIHNIWLEERKILNETRYNCFPWCFFDRGFVLSHLTWLKYGELVTAFMKDKIHSHLDGSWLKGKLRCSVGEQREAL